jgi:hypothetical protein
MPDETKTATSPDVSGEINMTGKLTLKTLGCNPSIVKTLEVNKVSIARMYGEAKAVKYQEDEAEGKVYTYFAGSFEGINLQDGTCLRSGKMFLPSGISEIMETAVTETLARDKNATIQFAFELLAVKSTNKSGYSYEAIALRKPEETDALAELRARIMSTPTYEKRKEARLMEKNADASGVAGKGGKVIDGNPPIAQSTTPHKKAS